ncbi:MAG: YoaK family protein [Sneathiellaceae bacterium]
MTGQEYPAAAAGKRNAGLAILLTALAAWVDAVGLVLAGDIFVSFMSGNSTQAVVALVQHGWSAAALVIGVILAFLIGVILGEWASLADGSWRQPGVYLLEAVLLWAVLAALSLGLEPRAALPPLALAMGVHNASLHPARGAAVRTYVTGTIVQLGRGLALMLRGQGGGAEVRDNGLTWLGFLAGGLLGGLAALYLGANAALLLPALAASAMAVVTAVAQRRERQARLLSRS